MRRSHLWTALLLLAVAAAVAGGLGALLKQEPGFYAAAVAAGPDPADAATAADVLTRFGDLKNDVRSKPEWGAAFGEAELNSFFREALGKDGGLGGLLPDGLSDPRVSISGDRVRVAARYGDGFWSTVLSVELRGWLIKGEPNTVALELCGLWAGALPIGSQSILERVAEAVRDSNVVATWYRHDGHPVGVFRLYADQPNPSTRLRRFQVADGKVGVGGRTVHEAGGPAVGGDGD